MATSIIVLLSVAVVLLVITVAMLISSYMRKSDEIRRKNDIIVREVRRNQELIQRASSPGDSPSVRTTKEKIENKIIKTVMNRNRTILRQWLGAVLGAVIIAAAVPDMAWGQTLVQQGVRAGSNTTTVNGTSVTAGQVVSAGRGTTVTVTTTDRTGESTPKVAKVTVTKKEDIPMTAFSINDIDVTYGTDGCYRSPEVADRQLCRPDGHRHTSRHRHSQPVSVYDAGRQRHGERRVHGLCIA